MHGGNVQSNWEKRRSAPGQKVEYKIQGERKNMRITQYLKYLALFPLMLFVICGAAKAQSIVTGAINGTVTDASGAVVADANVTLTSEATQEKQSVVTGPTGAFQFPLLKPGPYNVTVEKTGFRRALQKTEVQLGQTSTVNAKLE